MERKKCFDRLAMVLELDDEWNLVVRWLEMEKMPLMDWNDWLSIVLIFKKVGIDLWPESPNEYFGRAMEEWARRVMVEVGEVNGGSKYDWVEIEGLDGGRERWSKDGEVGNGGETNGQVLNFPNLLKVANTTFEKWERGEEPNKDDLKFAGLMYALDEWLLMIREEASARRSKWPLGYED